MRTDDFDYELPADLIAQTPAPQRQLSRLLVLDRTAGTVRHDRFDHLGCYLRPGDVLVANRTRVMPARINARRVTGGAVELLLLRQLDDGSWVALGRPSRKLRPGATLEIPDSSVSATVEDRLDDGQWVVRFAGEGDVAAEVHRIGRLPLPPYIRNPDAPMDRYQTVYADREGSVAAPTAGLHFTPQLLDHLRETGVTTAFVTLHVGIGTFKPVVAERIEDHRMHAEWGEVPAETADAINRARAAEGRVVAVGTTTTRLLESAWSDGRIEPFKGETDRFIYPGYRFEAIDALVTNFHLPRSTLLMMVSAFAGRDAVLAAYREAVSERYRFYSFGDAMLIV